MISSLLTFSITARNVRPNGPVRWCDSWAEARRLRTFHVTEKRVWYLLTHSLFRTAHSGCKSPDCLAQRRRRVNSAHPRRPPLTPTQLRKYERNILGYHRRAEAAITAKEMKGYNSGLFCVAADAMYTYMY